MNTEPVNDSLPGEHGKSPYPGYSLGEYPEPNCAYDTHSSPSCARAATMCAMHTVGADVTTPWKTTPCRHPCRWFGPINPRHEKESFGGALLAPSIELSERPLGCGGGPGR